MLAGDGYYAALSLTPIHKNLTHSTSINSSFTPFHLVSPHESMPVNIIKHLKPT
jgi:hypothetical protein